MKEDNTSAKHQSLSSLRLLKIMECLSARRSPVRLTDLAADMDMTQPTVLRYLNALCSENYAYQDPVTGSYGLTWKVCRIGFMLQNNINMRSIAAPMLNDLAAELDAGILLATERNGDVVYLDMVIRQTSMDTFLRIGKDAPIHSTSSGKIMLSSKSDAQIRTILAQKGLPKLTEYTITDQEQLLREIADVRKEGCAYDREECELGHRCVAVPLRDYTGKIVAAVSAFDNAEDLTDERIQKKILPVLKRAAAELSRRLGFEETER